MELKRRLSELGSCRGPHFGGERGGRMMVMMMRTRTSTSTWRACQSLMIFDGLEGGIFCRRSVDVGWW